MRGDLAYCPKGHLLAWLADDGEPTIHYWTAVDGLAHGGKGDNGQWNHSPHESIDRLTEAKTGRRELMCKHRHGGRLELDFADLLPVIQGDAPPLVLKSK